MHLHKSCRTKKNLSTCEEEEQRGKEKADIHGKLSAFHDALWIDTGFFAL